ncbi:heat shock 70 kDa protein 12A-like isoform X3 [Daktulosphaira vitifoliae]|uniref:heat shock 70 kDa protein 12A-like isoform X3 n=1 Tax=Daktulosphaira vitifoliae TaxID=58002 RepID=UPI0021AA9F3B|nr:heat shock 70 kDa protein 12A-like isoform X3 [Daktulosphaira vitifoliae]
MFTNSKKSELTYAIEPEASVYQINDRQPESSAVNFIDTYEERRRGRIFVDDPLSILGCVEEEPEYQEDDMELFLRYNSLDSGIPYEYEDNEIEKSINSTLNRLISLSVIQQDFHQNNEDNIIDFQELSNKSHGCITSSSQILNETFNLVEEVYVNRDQCHSKLQIEMEYLEDGIIVAVDLGTTYSGYAYSFKRFRDVNIMKKPKNESELIDDRQKIPTVLLLTPDFKFHSFGTPARDYFHDMHPDDAQKWYYFDKFKMFLCNKDVITNDTCIMAANNVMVPATRILSETLNHLKCLVYNELTTRCSITIKSNSITWILTVPAIWTKQTKQLIKDIAIKVGIGNSENINSVVLILEPEAASEHCQNVRLKNTRILSTNFEINSYGSDYCIINEVNEGCSYVVVDCGGGTVDITVHQLSRTQNCLSVSKLHKPSSGIYGSLSVDIEFIKLLCSLFGFGFMSDFKLQRPAAYAELLQRFEEVKKTVSSNGKTTAIIRPPYALADHYMKYSGKNISDAVKDYNCEEIQWNEIDGFFIIKYKIVERLFLTSFECISEQIKSIIKNNKNVTHMFLVGGYAQSLWLQEKIVEHFNQNLNIFLPEQSAVSVLKGAVLWELNRSKFPIHKAKNSYALGIIKPFIDVKHPIEKLVIKDGKRWCTDLLDYLIEENDLIRVNETITKRYIPANPVEGYIVINIYLVQNKSAKFVTDNGVSKCGSLKLLRNDNIQYSEELLVQMIFCGHGEILASAVDLANNIRINIQISETEC